MWETEVVTSKVMRAEWARAVEVMGKEKPVVVWSVAGEEVETEAEEKAEAAKVAATEVVLMAEGTMVGTEVEGMVVAVMVVGVREEEDADVEMGAGMQVMEAREAAKAEGTGVEEAWEVWEVVVMEVVVVAAEAVVVAERREEESQEGVETEGVEEVTAQAIPVVVATEEDKESEMVGQAMEGEVAATTEVVWSAQEEMELVWLAQEEMDLYCLAATARCCILLEIPNRPDCLDRIHPRCLLRRRARHTDSNYLPPDILHHQGTCKYHPNRQRKEGL